MSVGQTLLLRALMGWKTGILLKITQYVTIDVILQKYLHGDNTAQNKFQLFHSGGIEHGQDVSIGWNQHFVPGPKEPFTIHLAFGVIKI